MKLSAIALSLALIAGVARRTNTELQHARIQARRWHQSHPQLPAGVELVWPGEKGQQLRARFTLRDGQPLIAELAAQKPGGAWIELGKQPHAGL